MKRKSLTISIIFLFFMAAPIHVRAGGLGLTNITGRVRDEKGRALAGATVTIKELHKTGITNENGEFSLGRIHNGKYRVEIYFIAYEPYRTEIDVTEHIFRISVELKLIPNLDEVLVIAYGTTTRRLNTGNVTTVKDGDIDKQPVENPLLALEARVPGLFIVTDHKVIANQDQQLKELWGRVQATGRLTEEALEGLSADVKDYHFAPTTTSATAYDDSATRWNFSCSRLDDLDCEIHMTATRENASGGKGARAAGEIAVPTSIRFTYNPFAILPDTIIQIRDMIKAGTEYSYGGKLDFKLIVRLRYKGVNFWLSGLILFRSELQEPGLRGGDVPFRINIK